MNSSGQRRDVLIVGAGLGGVATAIRFLRCAREPVRITLLERRTEYRNGGAAYHREGNHWHHVFNIQAGRMSVFREDVDDFVDWANHEADRTGWPAEWRGFRFVESGPAPRRIYPDYLADRLAEAAREALPGVTLVEADGDAVDLDVVAGRAHVVVEDLAIRPDGPIAGRTVVEADHVVLATGLETKFPAFAADVLDHPAFVRDPYSSSAIERVTSIRSDATVAIVGTVLSAYDSASLLLRRGHTGTIHMISRSGVTLRTYPPDHQHRVLDLPPPRLLGDAYAGRDEFVRAVVAEWHAACARVIREHPDVSPAVVTERVAKSWEPHLPAILQRIPSDELRALLDGHGSLMAMLRVGVMAYTSEMVAAAMTDGGQVELTAGRVERIAAGDDGRLVVSVAGPSSRVVEADLVISNFGRESDYSRARSALWASLLDKGLAVPHRRTGRGVEVDERGLILDASGTPSGPVSVIGCPREGDEIMRFGRTGAFTFNLAAIKNHSIDVATGTLRTLESCYDEQRDVVAAALDGATASGAAASDTGAGGAAGADHGAGDHGSGDMAAALSRAVMLDVRRMATRARSERQSLTDRLDRTIGSVQEAAARNGGPFATEPALRAAVSVMATTKLKDLSVTPRELRANLGLDQAHDLTTTDTTTG